MKYDAHLSNILDQDIYIMNSGLIYLQFRGNQFHIGNTGSTISDLRDNIEKYI